MAVFATIAEKGSLSAAGRILGLTPSSISRIVARIEKRIGTRLLIRTTRAITFTAEGETYLRAARRILADLAEVEDAITHQGVPKGRIRVSGALAHGRLSLLPLVAEFSARHPAIVVDLVLSDEVVDILGGEADIAIRFGRLADSPLTARQIGETGQVVVASPDYLARHGTPQVPADLLKHNCLRFNFRRAIPDWPFFEDGSDFYLKVSGTIESNSGEALSQLARIGAGITRVGTFSVEEDLKTGALVPLLEDYNPGDREPINAVFVGGAAMPARVRAFVDFLVERYRDESS
ncbi:LysR family transcriptional regulator [Pseudomonas matsuisoli]|uniref:LysR family transcriptional regulator n=2 Tax=Pseudomonas matsuisoli TaxID=1515666 RepID=A0A917PQB7_9PSED|nr:LysR family transcriptional regulator [Pseudomonas matsuisoli]